MEEGFEMKNEKTKKNRTLLLTCFFFTIYLAMYFFPKYSKKCAQCFFVNFNTSTIPPDKQQEKINKIVPLVLKR